MAAPIFLYPSLTDDMKEGIFRAKKYTFSYTGPDGIEKDLECEESEIQSTVNYLKTDGVWSADKNNLLVHRTIALRNYKKLFGPEGVACKNATLGVSLVWKSPDSRQRGAVPVMVLDVADKQDPKETDHSFAEGEIFFEIPCAKIRGEIAFSLVLYIAKAGTPEEDETHLANEEGYVLGELDLYVLRIDGTGSLFPVYEVYEKDRPLWYVRCDWTDPVTDPFAASVSININTAHKNYKFIDRSQKTFCPQLLVEVMSSALCCIIEKIRSENYLDQILGEEDTDSGSIGEVIRYFSNTLGWDLSAPDTLSVTTREFFDRRITG